jgi:hypothetical protein
LRIRSNLLAPWAKLAIDGSVHVYEVAPRKNKRGIDLISETLPFARFWYGEPNVSRAVTRRAVTAPSQAKPMSDLVRWTLGLAMPQPTHYQYGNGAFPV